ncbi:MAG: hypothetical protein ABGZ35_10655 [Planctomycetaceae bacterium]
MTTTTENRREWTCPECERRFRIPVSASDPGRCPACQQVTSKSPAVKAVTATPPDNKTVAAVETPPPSLEGSTTSSPETQEILEHLRNISRTMTLFRRSVWVFVAINVVGGVIAYFAIKNVVAGSLDKVMDSVGESGSESGNLNDLLKEAIGQ